MLVVTHLHSTVAVCVLRRSSRRAWLAWRRHWRAVATVLALRRRRAGAQRADEARLPARRGRCFDDPLLTLDDLQLPERPRRRQHAVLRPARRWVYRRAPDAAAGASLALARRGRRASSSSRSRRLELGVHYLSDVVAGVRRRRRLARRSAWARSTAFWREAPAARRAPAVGADRGAPADGTPHRRHRQRRLRPAAASGALASRSTRAVRRRRRRRRGPARARRRGTRAPPSKAVARAPARRDRRRRRRRHGQRGRRRARRQPTSRSACCRSARSTTSPRTSASRSSSRRRSAPSCDGRPARVDVGEVNGRVFINNSSLGLYPRHRARPRAPAAAARPRQVAGVRLGDAGGAAPLSVPARPPDRRRQRALRRTPFVFIGNNDYRMEGFAIGERDRARRRPAEPLRGAAPRPPAAAAARAARAVRAAPPGARLRRDARQPRSTSRARHQPPARRRSTAR